MFTRSLFQETDHLDLTEFVIELFQPGEQFQAVPPMEAFHNCNKEDQADFTFQNKELAYY